MSASGRPSPLPDLRQASLVRITREGGIAYLPGLARARHIDLAACAIEDRARICQVLQRSAAFDDPRCGEGDRRYFRVEVVYQPTDGSDSRTVDFRIAEEDAPEALRQLWEEDRG